jgi:hypothetical protein
MILVEKGLEPVEGLGELARLHALPLVCRFGRRFEAPPTFDETASRSGDRASFGRSP